MSDNYITISDENGSINISEDVIAVMVAAALEEVEGVAGLAHTAGAELHELLGKKSVSKGVKIQFEDNSCVIDVVILVRFGCQITAAAQKVQAAISNAVESMTGCCVTVNVHVSGVSFEK